MTTMQTVFIHALADMIPWGDDKESARARVRVKRWARRRWPNDAPSLIRAALALALDREQCGYDARCDGWVCTDGRFIPSRTHPYSLIRSERAD